MRYQTDYVIDWNSIYGDCPVIAFNDGYLYDRESNCNSLRVSQGDFVRVDGAFAGVVEDILRDRKDGWVLLVADANSGRAQKFPLASVKRIEAWIRCEGACDAKEDEGGKA